MFQFSAVLQSLLFASAHDSYLPYLFSYSHHVFPPLQLCQLCQLVCVLELPRDPHFRIVVFLRILIMLFYALILCSEIIDCYLQALFERLEILCDLHWRCVAVAIFMTFSIWSALSFRAWLFFVMTDLSVCHELIWTFFFAKVISICWICWICWISAGKL